MQPTIATALGAKHGLADKKSVFEKGPFDVTSIKVKNSWWSSSSPPKPLFIVAPTTNGTYPVLLFFHGFAIQNSWYTQLLEHISSHGFIVVAPQFCMLVSTRYEVNTAAKIVDWLSVGLQSALPEKVIANLDKLALSGHSRGGKTAFTLALGRATTSLKFSVLLGLDPVAGSSPTFRCAPKILKYLPRSFDLSIPVAIIGTGLGDQSKGLIPPFAPHGVNHAEFFNESKPPCYYFFAKEYGHCDMLDEAMARLASLVCKSGNGSKDLDLMRKGVGGVFVAFLNAYVRNDKVNFDAIVDGTLEAPLILDPIISVKESCN